MPVICRVWMAGAKVAAAQVVRLDPNWSVEKYLGDGGGYPDDATTLFIEGRQESWSHCMCASGQAFVNANFIHIKACDEERTHQAAG